MATFNRAIETFIVYRLLSKIVMPFDEWPAYKMGLIDISGNKIKKPKTPEEEDQFSRLNTIARNLKKILDKYTGAKNKLATAIVGTALLKESFVGVELLKTECELHYNTTLTDRFNSIILDSIMSDTLEISESNIEPLRVGRYKVLSPFYEKEHICYIKSPTWPDGYGVYTISDVLDETIVCSDQNLISF